MTAADKDHKKNYNRPNSKDIVSDEIAFHFDEMCRLINEHYGPQRMDPRQASIIKLKLEEAMVWMLYTGMIRREPPPETEPQK